MKGKKKRYGILAAGFLTAATLGGTVYYVVKSQNNSFILKNEDIKNGQSQIAGHCPFLLHCICTYCFCGGSSRNLNAEAAFRRCSSPTEA